MQAIISDIIVSQAAQNGNLQISQPINNISSLNTSFADMLASLNKSEETQPVQNEAPVAETAKPVENRQAEPVENVKDDEKTVPVKDENLTKVVQKQDKEAEKDLKIPLEKNPKLKESRVKPEEVKTDPSKKEVKLNNTDSKKEKKVLTEDQKKALIEKLQLEEIQKEGNKSAVEENAQNFAALAGEEIQKPVNVKTADNSAENDEFEINDMALSAKTDAKKADVKEAGNVKEKISVLDLRTKPEPEEKEAESVEKTGKNLKVEFNADNSATVTMELDQQAQVAGENILSLDNQTAASDGSNFQAMVNNQIQANIPEFVQTGTVLLKDNDKGTINLILHPDDLGNVKIHLSMDGKLVSAHITVNTKEALEVFKDNAQTLREAFAKNGFDTANFDVSYNGSSNGQSNQDFKDLYDGSEFMARNAYGDFLGGGNEDGYIQDSYEFAKNSEYSINIVA